MIIKKTMRKLLPVAVWLSVWQLLSLAVKNEILLPSVPKVLSTLGELVVTADFWKNIAFSMGRIISGYVIGVVSGIIIAVICYKVKPAKDLLSPVISVIRTTPVASFIILALVWINKTWVPVFIVFLIVMPIVYQNIYDGIGDTPTVLTESAKIYRLSFSKRLKYIYFNSIKSSFKSALVTAFGLAWKSGIAAEVLAVPVSSIGYNIFRSKINIQTDALFAWTLVVILLSGLFEMIIKKLFRVNKNADNK